MLERLFQLKRHNTTPAVEVSAGLATFLTAAYILAANPMIQSHSGMPRDAIFTATALALIAGTLLIGLYANIPFLLAPGMGINAYFAYSVVQGQKFSWQEALTAIAIAGVLFLLTGVVGLREALLDCFPEPLKQAMTVSLGMMIAIIGLNSAGFLLIEKDLISLGNVAHGSGAVTLAGLAVTGILLVLRVPGAILLGIIATTLVGMTNGVTDYRPLLEEGAFSLPPSIAPIAFAFSLDGARLLTVDFAVVVLTFLIIDIFDSLGTFVGVFNHFEGEEQAMYQARIPRAMLCDAAASVAGACFGASTVTSYVESSTGIAAGGRTGLVAVSIAFLAALALFAWPLVRMIPPAATAPALVVVGMNMMAISRKIDFENVSEGLPSAVMIMVTALTWSISDGLMYGWTGYVLLKAVSGKAAQLNPMIVAVGLFFLARLLFL